MIDIVKFKDSIMSNKIDISPIIFVGKDESSKFIFHQYYMTYSSNNELEIIHLDKLENEVGFFSFDDGCLKLYETDELDYVPSSFSGWIYCKKIDSNLKREVQDNVLELPKLEQWQLVDYVSSVGNVEQKQAEEFVKEYDDLYKLDIELKKLSIFSVNCFDEIYQQIIDKSEYKLFDLSNAILRRDVEEVKNIYNSGLTVDSFALLSILIKGFKLIIDIQLSQSSSARSLGISDKQFWAVKKYNCNKYKKKELIRIYDFLTSIDLKIKTGKLPTNFIQDYILFNLIFV